MTDEGIANTKLPLIPKDSVVMSSRAPIGHLGIANVDMRTNQGCKSFYCKNNLDQFYLYFYLKFRMDDIRKLGSGSTFSEVSKTQLEDFEISIPKSIIEQKKLASKLTVQLSEIEKARAAVEMAIKDLNRLEFLVFDNFLSELKNTKGLKIGEYAITGSGSTPSRGNKRYWESGEIPWIKTGEIDFTPITKVEEYVTSIALKETSIKLIPKDSVLVAMVGQGKTRGKSAILKIPATINQNCYAIYPNDTWTPEFLQLWLWYSYQDLRNMSNSRGGSQPNFSCGVLNQVEIPAPPIEHQKDLVSRISKALHEVTKMKENWNKKKVEISNLPNRILTEAFKKNETGKE